MFELVSAYGTVGLSLGIPDVSFTLFARIHILTSYFQQNYSFVGAMHPLSKLVVCVVMLRGRHRGLPVAIDRAIMLPHEFKKDDEGDGNNEDTDSTFGDSPDNHRSFVHSETMTSRNTSGIRRRENGKSMRMSALTPVFDTQGEGYRTQHTGELSKGDREP